jgi:hypothetical protein
MALAAVEGGLENAKVNLNSQRNQSLIDEMTPEIIRIRESLVQLKGL